MPELPEVESIRALLEGALSGEEIESLKKSKESLRKPLSKSVSYFKGKKLHSFKRWGKKLYIVLEGEKKDLSSLEVSLGMSGAFRFHGPNEVKKEKHDHLVFKLKGGNQLIYNDPRRFGWVKFFKETPQQQSWDPLLGSGKQRELAIKALRKTERSLYAFLMDQTYITGLGNIYVQEALFRSGLDPNLAGKRVSLKRADDLLLECTLILKESVKLGGCTLKDHKLIDGSSGGFQHKLMVYGKKKGEPCLKCGAKLVHQKQPRTLTWCRKCQKRK